MVKHFGFSRSSECLIVPALALVVQGSLFQVNANHSSTSAVSACAGHQNIAAEFDYRTVGLMMEDEVKAKMRAYLEWARCPAVPLAPFATPYGPSVVFFYHGVTQNGAVTNMLDGCETDDVNGIVEHVRARRAELLDLEYRYENGRFAAETVSMPLHKRMWIAWARKGVHPDDPAYIATVIQSQVDARTGNLHTDHLRREIAMLVPVFWPQACGGGDFDRVTLQDKLRMELKCDSSDWKGAIAAMRQVEPPKAVWCEDDELEERLQNALVSLPAPPLSSSATGGTLLPPPRLPEVCPRSQVGRSAPRSGSRSCYGTRPARSDSP